MEDEKRKKKNKKKKNKQHKASEGPAVGVEETIAALDENHSSTQTHRDQNSIVDVQNGEVQKENVDLNGHCANGIDSVSLQERIKQFENEKELHTKKEATLEERIKQLQDENDSHLQMEADLDTKILQLQTEKHSWIEKEAILEGKIKQLLDENFTLSQKWAILDEKVGLQEREKDSWVLKENSSREIISSLNDDNKKLQAQVLELEEFRNNILQANQLLKENITSLHLQIKELERFSSAHTSAEIAKEHELFCTHHVYDGQDHASEHVDLNPQTDTATTALVEKLTSENADLVEKVNGLCIEVDRLRVAAGFSSGIGLDKKIGTLQNSYAADHMSEPTDNSSALGERMESMEAVPIHDQKSLEAIPMHYESSQEAVPNHDHDHDHDQISLGAVPINDVNFLDAVPVNAERMISADSEDTERTAVIPNTLETDDCGEIVKILLDENEARELELQAAAENDRNTTVPITDAPLIGAPFRFISFVAKYVSGADLVGKNSAN